MVEKEFPLDASIDENPDIRHLRLVRSCSTEVIITVYGQMGSLALRPGEILLPFSPLGARHKHSLQRPKLQTERKAVSSKI